MKSLVASLALVMVSGLACNLSAQSQSSSTVELRDVEHETLTSSLARLTSDQAIATDQQSLDTMNNSDRACAFMRTYRRKREFRNSDYTRPAGFTTCVPVAGFGVKRAVVLKAQPQPQ
jgi:hypothetical protein